jgi:hypothetical protein
VLVVLQPEFDALEALRCEGLQPPNPRVRPLDNLNKCLSILPQVGACLLACEEFFAIVHFVPPRRSIYKPPFPMNYSHEFPPPKNKECLRGLGFDIEWGGEWVLLAFCFTGAFGVFCKCPCTRTTLPGIDCSPTASQGLTKPMLFHRGALSVTVKCAFRCCISLLKPKP